MWHMDWNGAGFSGWENVGGSFKSAPGVASWGRHRLDVFGVGQNDAMWHMYWD
jgi:hypothetical protein